MEFAVSKSQNVASTVRSPTTQKSRMQSAPTKSGIASAGCMVTSNVNAWPTAQSIVPASPEAPEFPGQATTERSHPTANALVAAEHNRAAISSIRFINSSYGWQGTAGTAPMFERSRTVGYNRVLPGRIVVNYFPGATGSHHEPRRTHAPAHAARTAAIVARRTFVLGCRS